MIPGLPGELSQNPFAELNAPPFDPVPSGMTGRRWQRDIERAKPLPEEPPKQSDVLIVRDNAAGANEF